MASCRQCGARFLFRRARAPRFDYHGCERYELDRKYCGASLVGIIDARDGTLLLSDTQREAPIKIGANPTGDFESETGSKSSDGLIDLMRRYNIGSRSRTAGGVTRQQPEMVPCKT
jgi:hypothetical protein